MVSLSVYEMCTDSLAVENEQTTISRLVWYCDCVAMSVVFLDSVSQYYDEYVCTLVLVVQKMQKYVVVIL